MLVAPPSRADSGEVQFSCTFDFWSAQQWEGPATARFDTAIPDGFVAKVGDAVPFAPSTGTITFPDALTDQLRAKGVTALVGELGDRAVGDIGISVDDVHQSYESLGAFLTYPRGVEMPVPAEGPMSVQVVLEGYLTFIARDVGKHTLVTDGFYLPLFGSNERPSAGSTAGRTRDPSSSTRCKWKKGRRLHHHPPGWTTTPAP